MKCGGRGSVGPGEKNRVTIARSQFPLCRVCGRQVDALDVDDSEWPESLAVVALCHGRVAPVTIDEPTLARMRAGDRPALGEVFAGGAGPR